MSVIVERSEIMLWNRENIERTPDSCGVYTLRTSTTIESIIYIGMAGDARLRERLLDHFNQKDISGVLFFDWYRTQTEADARELEQLWITKYHPQCNTQI